MPSENLFYTRLAFIPILQLPKSLDLHVLQSRAAANSQTLEKLSVRKLYYFWYKQQFHLKWNCWLYPTAYFVCYREFNDKPLIHRNETLTQNRRTTMSSRTRSTQIAGLSTQFFFCNLCVNTLFCLKANQTFLSQNLGRLFVGPFRGPKPLLICCLWNHRETIILRGVTSLARGHGKQQVR